LLRKNYTSLPEKKLIQLQLNLSESIASSSNLKEVIEAGIETALQAACMDCGCIYLFNENSGNFHLHAYHGLSHGIVQIIKKYNKGSNIINTIDESSTTHNISDTKECSLYQALRKEGFCKFTTLLLKNGKKVIGCLILAACGSFSVSETVKAHLEMIATQISNFIFQLQICRQLYDSQEQINSLMFIASGYAIYQLAFDDNKKYNLRHIYTSRSIETILGYTPEEWNASTYYDNVHPDDQKAVIAAHKTAFKTNKFEAIARVYNPKKKAYVWTHAISVAVPNQKGEMTHVNGILIDINEKQKAQLKLVEKEKYLKAKSEKLNQLNITLHTLLEKREKDRIEIEQNFLYNIKEMVLPYLKKMHTSNSLTKQKNLLDIVELNLKEITSGFTLKLSIEQLGLSPAEIKVATFVRQGKTSKEIASILGLSPKTIINQRDRIRRKLGICGEKINLRTYLLSLPQ
jgi:PAS domain S-box-containing protein